MASFTWKESVLLVILVIGLSKECAPPHPDFIFHYQNRFCQLNDVMIGKVESVDEVNNTLWRHKVRIEGIIKGFRPSDVGTVQLVYSPSVVGSCGVRLTVGEIYVFGGSKSNLFIRFPGVPRQYFGLTVQQHMYIWLPRGKLSYRANCRCKVSRTASDSTCLLLKSNDSCYDKRAICSYNRRTRKCEWLNTDTCRNDVST